MLRSVLEKSASFHGFSNFSILHCAGCWWPLKGFYIRGSSIFWAMETIRFSSLNLCSKKIKTYFRKIFAWFFWNAIHLIWFISSTDWGKWRETMTEFDKQKLGKTLWNIADQLRGAECWWFSRLYASILFLRYLSDTTKQLLKRARVDYPKQRKRQPPLTLWYEQNRAGHFWVWEINAP